MTFKFSERSLKRMEGIHPDLVAVMELAIQRTPIDFMVLEGLRDVERQRELVRRGASKTMNSRHLTGHAVDVAPIDGGQVSWDWPLYHKLAPVIKGAAEDLGVDIEWGGDWTSFKDGPHWQLAWHTYGKDDMRPRATLEQPIVEKVSASQHRQPLPTPEPVSKERTHPIQSTTIWAQIKQFAVSVPPYAYGIWNALQEQDPTTRYIILGGLVLATLYVIHLGRHIISERLEKWGRGIK